jgi:hypothetical protein
VARLGALCQWRTWMNVGVGKLVAPSYSRDIVTVSNDLQFASRENEVWEFRG